MGKKQKKEKERKGQNYKNNQWEQEEAGRGERREYTCQQQLKERNNFMTKEKK
jgi:hypothetical protein